MAAQVNSMVGSFVWVEDPEEAWMDGEVVEVNGEEITVNCASRKAVVAKASNVFPKDPEFPPCGVDDMTKLAYLHEPGVLQNLRCRYDINEIYTYTGNILIAVNPFRRLPHLYDNHMMEQYNGATIGELSPHPFAVADSAYRQMINEGISQSILVSGEGSLPNLLSSPLQISMENNIATKQANLPSNYVTLGQLQERWIKEQQRKQTEKEQQEEHDHKKLHNEVAEPGHLSPSVSVSPPSIRRNSNRESHRWSLVGTNVEESKAVSVADLEENVDEKREEMKTKKRSKGNERKKKKKGEARAQEEGEVTGNLIGTNVEESKTVLVAFLEENVNDKREEMKTKKKSWKRTGKKKGEARAQEEEGKLTGNLIGTNVEELKALSVAVLEENVNEKREEMKTKKIWKGKGMKGEAREKEEEWGLTGSGAQALLVKSEKNNGGCERKREMRAGYRAKAEKAAEENNQTVEIEKEIGDLSVERKSEKSKTPNKVNNGRISNRESKDYSGYANRGHWNYRGDDGGGYRGNGQYRGGYGRFNGENGRYAGGYGSGYGQWKERRNAKVWMKKEEAGDGGDMARNQSSSVSSKELE